MNSPDDQILYPNEPSRFEPRHIDDLLIYCHRLNVSDITLQSNSAVIIELHGRISKITRRELSNPEVSELLNAIYGPNGTTQIMRGEDLDTHYEIRPNRTERFRYRINATGCHVDGHEGIQITIRTILLEPPELSQLGLPEPITKAIAPSEGIVYVTGATGSGKSTLLAAIIKSLAQEPDSNRKILTYEAPIEYVYDSVKSPSSSVCQSEIPRHLPSFSSGVRNALRRKPHAILVGETRDRETITAVLEAALTGHPVYTTLHSNGVPETIRRLVSSFNQDESLMRTIDIIETLRLIIWQKLVPSVNGKRVALREYLVFNEKIRDQLLGSDPNKIIATTRKLLLEHGQTMRADIEKNFKEGLISNRTYNILSSQIYQSEKNECSTAQ